MKQKKIDKPTHCRAATSFCLRNYSTSIKMFWILIILVFNSFLRRTIEFGTPLFERSLSQEGMNELFSSCSKLYSTCMLKRVLVCMFSWPAALAETFWITQQFELIHQNSYNKLIITLKAWLQESVIRNHFLWPSLIWMLRPTCLRSYSSTHGFVSCLTSRNRLSEGGALS